MKNVEPMLPKINVDILVKKNNTFLLGLLSEKWAGKDEVYGVPGRDILLNEHIGDTVRRNIREDLGCEVGAYEIIAVNANYEHGNHYIGIGVVAEIKGDIANLQPEDWKKWEWFSLSSVPTNLFAPAKNLIDCFNQKKFCISE